MNFEQLREDIETTLHETAGEMLDSVDKLQAENYIRAVEKNILHKTPSKKELVKEAYATGAMEAIERCKKDIYNLLTELEEEENEKALGWLK